MRKLLVFVVALIVGVLMFHLWWNRLPPFDGHSDPVDTPFANLKSDQDSVRVKGLAHHAVRAERFYPGGFLRAEKTFWIWPLFAPNDPHGKKIEVMVASHEEPPWGVDFEDVQVEGWVRPPRARVDIKLEKALRGLGYRFGADYLLIELFPNED
jgi:hypothetical protein